MREGWEGRQLSGSDRVEVPDAAGAGEGGGQGFLTTAATARIDLRMTDLLTFYPKVLQSACLDFIERCFHQGPEGGTPSYT